MGENISRENSNLLKGFSILCIMCCHFLGEWTRFVTPIAGIGVALFLICSGYGLEKSYQKNGLKQFWRKRFWAVFFPYALFNVVRVGMGYESLLQFVEDVTLIKPMFGYGWYLNYLLIWYLIFYFSHLFIKNEKLKDIFLLFVSMILLIYYVLGDQGLQIEQSFMFVLGVFLAKYDFSKIYKKRNAVAYVIIAVIALAMKQVPSVRNSTGQIMRWMDLITKSFMGFGIVVGVAEFRIYEKIKSLLAKVGMISFELYLMHGTVIGIVKSHIKSPIGIFPYLVLSIVIAYIYYVFLEIIRNNFKRMKLRSV